MAVHDYKYSNLEKKEREKKIQESKCLCTWKLVSSCPVSAECEEVILWYLGEYEEKEGKVPPSGSPPSSLSSSNSWL